MRERGGQELCGHRPAQDGRRQVHEPHEDGQALAFRRSCLEAQVAPHLGRVVAAQQMRRHLTHGGVARAVAVEIVHEPCVPAHSVVEVDEPYSPSGEPIGELDVLETVAAHRLVE